MALFPQQYFTFGSDEDRTFTNLVRSEGNSPAEKWILDPSLPGLFEYRFGGFGYVVVPKGTILAVGAPTYDSDTQKLVNYLTIATGSNNPVGVAPYNFYEAKKDRMGDNQLSIINREYIEVPYFHNTTAATQAANLQDMKWGCASSRIFDATYATNTLAELSAGDFVKPDLKGRFVRWAANKVNTEVFTDVGDADADVTVYVLEPIKAGSTVAVSKSADGATYTAVAGTSVTVRPASGAVVIATGALADADHVKVVYTSALSDPIEQRVGQVLAVETDLPPLGWLAYFLDMRQDDNELNDAIRNASYPPAGEGGYPAYGYKADYVRQMKQLFDAQNPKGIPFLTDGYFRAKKAYGNSTTPANIHTIATSHFSNIATARLDIDSSGVLTVAPTTGDPRDLFIYIKAKAPIAVDGAVQSYTNNRSTSGVEIFFTPNGSSFDYAKDKVREGVKYAVDYKNQTIVLMPTEADNGATVTIICALIEDQIPGLPTEWDYAGTVGAVRILLGK